MVAPVYHTTWQHIPEHHIHYHEKHKSFTVHYNLLILWKVTHRIPQNPLSGLFHRDFQKCLTKNKDMQCIHNLRDTESGQRQDHAPCSMFDTSALYIMHKSWKHMCMLIFHAALMISTYWNILVHAKKENSNTAVGYVPQIVTSSSTKSSTDFLHAFPSLNLCQKYSFANAGNTFPL